MRRDNEHTALYRLKTGVEFSVTDILAIRTTVSTGDTFDDPSFKSVTSDNLFFNGDIIWWIDDSWFSRLGFGSDFDETDVQVSWFIVKWNYLRRALASNKMVLVV